MPDWSTKSSVPASYGRSNIPIAMIQGTPYLDNAFKNGTVTTAEGKVYNEIPLRYNCFLDVLEFQKEKAPYIVNPKNVIKRAEFGWQKYMYYEIKSLKGYFGILAEGHATLLVHYSLRFNEPGPSQGFAEAAPASFDDLREVFYIIVNNAPAVKVNNYKKLLEVLGDKKEEVKAYMTALKLSTEKPEHMKKIINYYNTL